MNDEQFESVVAQLENHGGRYAMLASKLCARDTAQREALARVEAERDQLVNLHGETLVLTCEHRDRANTAQALLAEAVGLLSAAVDYCYSPEAYEKGRAFLARHAQAQAQAEQQEAQGAQAGEFWTWLDLTYRDGSKGEGRNFTKHNMEVAYRAGTEAARAALATQPAAGEVLATLIEVDSYLSSGRENSICNGSKIHQRIKDVLLDPPAGSTTSDQYRAELYDEVWQKARDMGYGNVTDALVALERIKATPPAAAHEDEAVAEAIYNADRSVFMTKREYSELNPQTKARLLKMARAARGEVQ